jgi:hypothetical protein
MRPIGQLGVAWLTLALLLVQVGCATVSRPLPRPLPPKASAELGRVGVVSGRFVPAIDVQRPTAGKGSAAVRGAMMGAGAALAPFSTLAGTCSGRDCGLVAVVMLGVLIGVATVGAVTGAVVGAVTAESPAKVHDAEATLTHALTELKVQEALRDRLLTIARDSARVALVPGGEIGPTESDMAVDYRPLAAQGLDTILEVSVTRLGLTGDRRANPLLALSMTIRIRLIRTEDGAELYQEGLDHRSGSHKFVAWAANDAEAFRQAMDAAYTDVSGEIVRLVLPPPVHGPGLRRAPTPPAPEPSLSTVPLNVWKSAPIGEQGAMVRYRLIEKGSPLDTCGPPLVSVHIYEGGVQCAPAELVE